MTKKMLLSILVVGTLGALAGVGTFAAFSGATQNSGNSFVAGTVVLGDNDGGALPLYDVTEARPSQSILKCIKVTYTGSLDADVKLYTESTMGGGAQYMNLKIEKGTSDSTTFPNCGTFTAGGTLFDGTLAAFGTGKNSYDTGLAAYPGAATKWAQNDSLVYRFTLTMQDVGDAQGASSGSHGFKWEARNQ